MSPAPPVPACPFLRARKMLNDLSIRPAEATRYQLALIAEAATAADGEELYRQVFRDLVCLAVQARHPLADPAVYARFSER